MNCLCCQITQEVLPVWQVCWFCLHKGGRNGRFLCNQQRSHSTDEWSLEQWSAHPVEEITAKIVALKFVEIMLWKLWLSSLWRVAERILSHSAYSCQPPWWWIIDHLCQSAICHTLPQTKFGNMEGSEKKTNKKTTITWWQTPLGRTLPRRKWPRACRAVKLTHVVDRTQALCNERAFGMSLRARRVLDACIIRFEAVGRSRLLNLAPLSNPGIKSRIREKIPEGWRTTFHDNHPVRFKLDFKLAWHKV